MYTLYWNPSASSLVAMAVLEEIGADYEGVLIDAGAGEHRKPEYRKIHPLGLIPALRLADGRVMFESAGIVLHLCDRHAEAGLAPSLVDPERAFYYQWLLFLADTLYPTYNRFYHAERFSSDPGDAHKVMDQARKHLADQWQVVEDALQGRRWLLGERFSAADIYMQMVTTWDENGAAFAARHPNIARCAAGVAERPAVKRALDRHVILSAIASDRES